tara:strand:+ start:2209 stop:2439 length:231 start_codon:yes stop_codon:yes gene_type:complete
MTPVHEALEPFTPETVKKYLEDAACPYCGCDDTEETNSFDSYDCTERTCNACQAVWQEFYNVVSIAPMRPPEEETP